MRYVTKRNRAILRAMISTDFKVRYQGSVLGYLWSLLRPLLMFGVLYVVFVYIFNLNKGVPHYGVYLLLGIVLWNFFLETTAIGMTSIVARGDLIRKISIPRYLVVVSTTASALINLTLNLLVVLVFALFNGVHPSTNWLLLLPLLFELFVFSLAVAFFLATLYVKFRDVTYIWEVFLQAAFYGTPILYPLSLIPVRFQKFEHTLLLNPIAQIIQDARYAVITRETVIGWNVLRLRFALVPIVIVLVMAAISIRFFKKQSKYFAENL